MYFLYIDESGSPHGHHEPLRDGETPVFCLTGIAVRHVAWRGLDRQYLYLKRRFFAQEIGSRRAEYYEVKGSALCGPHHAGSRRRAEFLRRGLRLAAAAGVRAFSIQILKRATDPMNHKAVYGLALQYLVERMHLLLEDEAEHGVMIIDSRNKELDDQLARAHLSYIFGNETGRTFSRMLEAPLFADSRLTVGLQLADIVGYCCYANTLDRRCRGLPGVPDYSHMSAVREDLIRLQFVRPASIQSPPIYGYRWIDWR